MANAGQSIPTSEPHEITRIKKHANVTCVCPGPERTMILPPNMEIEKTYQKYLSEIREIDLAAAAGILGLDKSPDGFSIRFFASGFAVRPDGFFTASNKRPPYEICIVLCKYLLMCPETKPADREFASFKDFKDAGPLTAYFAGDVENLICRTFSGRLTALETAGGKIGGHPAVLDADYDLILRFEALPMIPMVLLFNDKDEDFPAQAKILFEKRAGVYLDAECLAILGNLLFQTLTGK